MIHQSEVWEYLQRSKRTDMVARHFRLTPSQAITLLRKMEKYGHVSKTHKGQWCIWKAVGESPRTNAYEFDKKRDREDEILMHLAFVKSMRKKQLSEKTGFSEWILRDTLESLEKKGLVEQTECGWRMRR